MSARKRQPGYREEMNNRKNRREERIMRAQARARIQEQVLRERMKELEEIESAILQPSREDVQTVEETRNE